MTMISVDIDSTRFNYRAGGVALHEGRVLLTRLVEQDFWFLPGGRVDIREASSVALRREIREELTVDVEVGRLLWVVENFFTDPHGKTQHEVGLYYEMRFAESTPLLAEAGRIPGNEAGYAIEFQWLPVEALGSITLYPPFLVEGLRDLPEHTAHIVEVR